MGQLQNTQKIKGLKSQVEKLKAERQLIIQEVAVKQQQTNMMKRQISEIESKIKQLENITESEPKCSEHAILRLLERKQNINLDYINGYILSPKIKQMLEVLGGNGKYPHEDGFTVVFKDYTATTII